MTLSMPMVLSCTTGASIKINPKKPKKAMVFWYSQTGNTERTGRLIAETLKKKGLEVVAEASSGEEALAMVETHEPDMILMDLNM